MNRSFFGFLKCVFSIFLLTLLGPRGASAQRLSRIVETVNDAQRVSLKGNVHPLARREFDRGAAPDVLVMSHALLLLKRSEQQEAALQNFLAKQQDKSSPNYHQWLTPQEFGEQYGPADADIQTVIQWLTQKGFQIDQIYSAKTVIQFSGTAAQFRAAFGTDIHNYQVGSKTYVANANDPQIPVALAPVVAGLVSLNNFPKQSHARYVGQVHRDLKNPGTPPILELKKPLLTLPGGANGLYALAPGDFATIYNSTPLLSANPATDGTGQTIAIVAETNINLQDVKSFRNMFGLPPNFAASNIIVNGEDPGITFIDEESEADLDAEWTGAVAPGATVYLIVSASTTTSAGIDLSALYIIEHNLAGVMSESYGSCETSLGTAGNAFYNTLWEQAAAQGITVILSAGDGGSAGCDDFNAEQVATQGLAVNGLASTPFNVSVGGTDFNQVNQWSSFWNSSNGPVGTSAKSYIPEIPWNQNCAQLGLTGCGPSAPPADMNIVAGSGGPSSVYGKPDWQLGVAGMPNDNHRDQPDISLFSSSGFNGSGYVYCQSDLTISGNEACDINIQSNPGLDFGIIGGTSAAAPAFAGIMALVNQKEATAQNPSPRQGNANLVLYQLANRSGASCASGNSEASSCIFNDVVTGNSGLTGSVGTNSVPCQGGTANCSSATANATGVLVDPAKSATEAWTTAAGYDMATGLGSVNVNNLVSSWNSVSIMPTTTTLVLSPTTGITHGSAENVSVNISVTPTNGTARGVVSLVAILPGPNGTTTTQGLDQFTLDANGSFSGTTRSLPGGSNYQVHAHYAGDGTNAASDSPPVTVTVAQETSQTFIVVPTFDVNGNVTAGNTTSVPFGSRYVLRMYVTDKSAIVSSTGPPSPTCDQVNLLSCPAGTVSLTDNGAVVGVDGFGTGVYRLDSVAYTQDLAPALATGTHALVATYSGDGSFLGSKSATLALTVTQDPTTISQNLNVTNPVAETPFGVVVQGTAQNSVGVSPTGFVTFFDGTTQLGVPVPAQGATNGALDVPAALTIQSPGPHTLTANYSGDSVYAASTNSIALNVLNRTTSTVSFAPATVIYGAQATISGEIDTFVPASNATLKPTGTVTLYAGTDGFITQGVSVTPMANSSGNWALFVAATIVPHASEGFQMSYSGDGNYGASNAISSSFLNVDIPDFSISSQPAALMVSAAQGGTVHVNVVPASNLSSSVLLTCGNVPTGFTCAVQPTTVNLGNGVTSIATLSVTPTPPPMIASGALGKKRSAVFFTSLARNPLWPASLAGIFALLACLGPLPKRKHWRRSLGFVAASLLVLAFGCGGSNSGGGGNLGGGGGGGGNGPFTTATRITVDSATVAAGGSVTFTSQVTGAGNPTGTVCFFVTNLGCTNANLVAGTASVQTTIGNPGVYAVIARYEGDAHNDPSASAPINESVAGSAIVYVAGNTGSVSHSAPVSITIE